MKDNRKKRLLVAMYAHIEGYPPSLNAVQTLSCRFDEIVVVHRNVMKTEWKYPANIRLSTTREYCDVSRVARKSPLWKAKSFLQYTFVLLKETRRTRPEWVLLHEPVAMVAWYIVSKLTRQDPGLWYHNHDIFSGKENFFFFWANKAQRHLFSRFRKFSLPSNDRIGFFPMERFKGTFYFIPNYPGRYLYDRFYKRHPANGVVRIIYQGMICAGHGLETVLQVIKEGIGDTKTDLRLILKGFPHEDYVDRLLEQADQFGIRAKVEVHGVTSYYNVPEVASSCHIGIGIHTKDDPTNKTLGTASNKIYEYAAVGLPVILHDNPQFRKHLSSYRWAFFTDCTVDNMKDTISAILENYEAYSDAARRDFETKLNFEEVFGPAMHDM